MATPANVPSLPIYLFTFNCARELVNATIIAPHVFSALDPSAPPPEIVAIGLQEFAPISYSFLGGDYSTPYLDQWSAVPHLASQSLNQDNNKFPAEYVEIGRQHVGMTALLLFSRRPEKVKSLRFSGVGFGVAGMGNKGAVAARFTYIDDGGDGDTYRANESNTTNGINVTIVSAHLSAHEHCCADRNRDWETLVRGIVFDGTSPSSAQETTPLLQSTNPTSTSTSGIYAPNTHLLLMGDLNYRTSATAPKPSDYTTFPKTASDLPAYFAKDQLNFERSAGNTLHGLTEAPINFPPTYKYLDIHPAYKFSNPSPISEGELPGGKAHLVSETAAPDLYAYAPHRWPSWCDRILWLPVPEIPVKVYKYAAIPTILLSDHRPVALHVSLPPIRSSEAVKSGDLRLAPPFPLDMEWKSKRSNAVAREWIVGYSILTVTTVGGAAVATCAIVSLTMLWWSLVGTAPPPV
ncbi:Synaptojanin-2 [Arthrobotrys entomopaga]|nr:Synaptojanin-2 [Arthrobotrys entomopaga]